MLALKPTLNSAGVRENTLNENFNASVKGKAYMGLVPCTPEQWRKVVSIAIAVGSVVCYTTGIIGYLSFRGATLGNILENFDGVVSDIASVLLVAHLAWYTPSEFVIMRHSVFQLCGKAPLTVSSRLLFLTTAMLLGLMVAICVALSATGVASGEAFGIILNLSGGIIGSIVSFILPALMYKRWVDVMFYVSEVSMLAVPVLVEVS
eukprot:TRINITY_DN3353_c0_g1_i1.p1 TRINITY_DN3353_c0_g1~~TRINITY_DN3353_c0_g1_i1.p1  ORF type:complete len:206 (-),score=28.26 TRINITY_DN3353_c0_g1_i1:455-1072(-)